MDLSTAVAFSLLVLFTAGSDDTKNHTVSTPSSSISASSPSSPPCTCPPPPTLPVSTHPSSTSSPSSFLLTVRWTGGCEGGVLVAPLSRPPSPVCHSQSSNISWALRDVCVHRKGCEGPAGFHPTGAAGRGYAVTDSGVNEEGSCLALGVRCKAEASSDVQTQLQAYKVVTALLCCLLLILLLIRFTRPTVQALQKRLSDRRQNRWIGPTQSHSVSYHRGKVAVRSNDAEKRLSYPALERLTISNSRDPPSNRSSYNL